MNIPRSISQPSHAKQVAFYAKKKGANNYYEYSSFYKPTTQNKLPFTPRKNALIIIMNIPRSIGQRRKTSSLSHKVETR